MSSPNGRMADQMGVFAGFSAGVDAETSTPRSGDFSAIQQCWRTFEPIGLLPVGRTYAVARTNPPVGLPAFRAPRVKPFGDV
jgi:hypothetical protein